MLPVLELNFEENFSLIHTFECGQIFRFKTFDDGNTYYGTLEDRVIKISQSTPKKLVITSNLADKLEEKVRIFLRTNLDYLEMQKAVAVDDLMSMIIKTTDGLHLLKQERFECFIAYFLSQCSNIPRITKHLNYLAKTYGKEVIFDEKYFYLFPSREDLIGLNEEDFREMGFGYRAKYINNFIHNYPDFLDKPYHNSEEFNKKLQKIQGIGQKVADCIQLFTYGDLEYFAVDTWMKKFMMKYYYKGTKKNPIKEIRDIGNNMFGKWAGYAQELIFRYARCYDSSLI